ncbi:hypothetical protein [Amaricoccus tamworthensis]|uniref:hypothetical protein n=1 Tax=Amaricoccus tamworthensis TaxID=57002 RepID=UPI003C7ED1D0
MRILSRIAACTFTALFAVSVQAEEFVYETRGANLFSFDVPDGWEVLEGVEVPEAQAADGTPLSPKVVSIRPPDEEGVMWTGFWSPVRLSSISGAKSWMERVIPYLLAEPENLYYDRRTVGGKPTRFYSGQGVRDGRDFDYAFAIIQISPDHVAVAAFIGEPDAYDRHEQELIGVLRSIAATEAM